MRLDRLLKFLALLLITSGAPGLAQDAAGPPTPAPAIITRVNDNPVSFADLPAPRRFVTKHETVIRGRRLRYTATAGETYITNLYGEPIARFFSFAYVKDGARDPLRPVTFVFNGGPGSSSLWLHMGVMGPKRLVLDREVNPSSVPPFAVEDNPHSPLDVTDLVFIDPVDTGFSQAVGNARNADFYGVDEDAESVARFIELWLTENGRWNSPKYLVGESYGSVRAAILPRALIGGPFYAGVMRGITIDGIVLLGLALDSVVRPSPDAPANPDAQAVLALPSMAATAWYHNRIDRAGRTVEQLHEEVGAFAQGEYADALSRLRAKALPQADKEWVAARLASYTGLPQEIWLKNDLRVAPQAFLKTLLADQGLAAGAYDSRYTLPLANSGNDPVADDPAMGRYVPGFVAAFHQMLRDDLRVRMPVPYSAITWVGLNFNWNWKRTGVPPGQSAAVDLATAMRRNPDLRVLVASGYYDLVTTPAAGESQIRRGGLPADRVTFRNYESGHMLYLGDTAEQFADDVRALILGGRPTPKVCRRPRVC